MNMGLTNDNSQNNITYGIWTTSYDTFEVVYNNITVTGDITYNHNDTITIATSNKGVIYYKNGEIIYSNTLVNGTLPLFGMFGFDNFNYGNLIEYISFGYISNGSSTNYGARFGVTGSQTLPTTVDQIIQWTRTDFNTGNDSGIINTSTIASDGKFSFNYLGNFLISASIPISANASGVQRNIQIRDSKGNNPITINTTFVNNKDQMLQLTACVNVTSTSDQYWIKAYQDSGISLNTTINGNACAQLSIS